MGIYDKRARRGAGWLDNVEPGWRDAIDLDRLDLGSGCNCICGQVFAEMADIYSRSGAGKMNGFRWVLEGRPEHPEQRYSHWADQRGVAWAREHGFLIDHKGDDADHERELRLQKDAWARLIHSAPSLEESARVVL